MIFSFYFFLFIFSFILLLFILGLDKRYNVISHVIVTQVKKLDGGMTYVTVTLTQLCDIEKYIKDFSVI